MRPRYVTEAIVLKRTPLSEASALLHLLTREFGLIRARAQGIRKPGAKLATPLQTFIESDVILVRGKEGWRLSGATPRENHFGVLSTNARHSAGRVSSLVLRLVQGEVRDPELFDTFRLLLTTLSNLEEADTDAIETLAVLRTLRVLGFDAGALPSGIETYAKEALESVKADRRSYIIRVNHGITASGL